MNPSHIKTVVLDAGHGMSNRRSGSYDPGAVANSKQEATLAMEYVNCLRVLLLQKGYRVIRTRVDEKDPAPVGQRDDIARKYNGDIMLSIHCNSTDNPSVTGSEVFYRGAKNKPFAAELSYVTADSLNTKNRGAKTEARSQHKRLAVLNFDKSWLLELGFISSKSEAEAMDDDSKMLQVCTRIANLIELRYPLK